MEKEAVLRKKRMLKRLNKYRQMLNKRVSESTGPKRGESD